MNSKIRTRFAPSPTGQLHIGGLRTALYSYALAKHSEGEFALRIEDTDKKREVPGAKEKIQELLRLFGLNWDGSVFIQSQRAEEGIYKKVAEELVKLGHAFYCDCKAKNAKEEGYSKELRDPCRDKGKAEGAIKLKVPDREKISFKDFVLDKEISWESNVVPDTTLLKSDGFPTYHLGVVIDDHAMEITHVLRGHDWMPSTPIHLLVYKYLGYDLPEIGHLTDILDPEGGKLSKRKGSVGCEALLVEGYLPEAILNFVMLLGWAPKDNRELFSLEEFVKAFDSGGLQKSNPVFNGEKLDWFNGHYIRQKSDSELAELVMPYAPKGGSKDEIVSIIPLVKDRLRKLSDFSSLASGYFEDPPPMKELESTEHRKHLEKAAEALENIDKWEKPLINNALMEVIKKNDFKTGEFFMSLRMAEFSSNATPSVNDSIEIFGKEKTLRRIKQYLK
jgi:glutamyl-tRNA synthetase